MASEQAEMAPPTGGVPTTFTLQIVSPSSSVPRGLSFPELPTSTTLSQLKEKIRKSLETKPADQMQRLIYRGHLLSRENQTMQEIFGEETLRSADVQTLHLVIRDLSETHPADTASPSAPNPTAPSTGHIHPQAQPGQPLHAHLHHHYPFQPQAQIRFLPPPQFGLPPPQFIPPPPPQFNAPLGYNPQVLAQQQAQQQRQWAAAHAAQVEHHNRLQELINQNQRDRASMGLNGAQDQGPNQRGIPGAHTPGRNGSPFQPDATRTVVREGVGPNGQQWRITVNESVSTQQGFQRNSRTGSPALAADIQNLWRPPNGAPQPRSVPPAAQLSGAEVQNIMRAADAGQAATRVMTDAMRRNASSSSLANLANSQASQPIPPGVTTPLILSRVGTPTVAPDSRTTGFSMNVPTSQPQVQSSSGAPEVYILSSPDGPRALLLNGNIGGTYVSPQNPQRLPLPQRPFPFGTQFTTYQPPNPHLPHRSPVGGMWAPPPPGDQPHQAQPQGQAPQGLPPLPQAQPLPGHAVAQPGNVQVRAIVLAQIWPHIWMVVRLGLFIWWFTSPNSSWTRIFTVISIAIALFLVNTGLLTPIAEQIWVPVRRHLENLMPLADGHHRDTPPGGTENAPNAQVNGQQMPRPADTAARLVQQRRRANGNWLMTQARRLERAGILFLASIAPGVAERHIAHLEAEAQERQRREEAAAEAARAQAGNSESTDGVANHEDSNPAPAAEAGNQPEPAPEDRGNNARPQQEPLIVI